MAIDRDGLINLLEKEGLTVAPTLYSPEGITVGGLKGPINHLNSFTGNFVIQQPVIGGVRLPQISLCQV